MPVKIKAEAMSAAAAAAREEPFSAAPAAVAPSRLPDNCRDMAAAPPGAAPPGPASGTPMAQGEAKAHDAYKKLNAFYIMQHQR